MVLILPSGQAHKIWSFRARWLCRNARPDRRVERHLLRWNVLIARTISAVVEDGSPIYAQFRPGRADLYRNQDFDLRLCKAGLDQEPSIGFWPAASIRLALVASSRAVASDNSEPPRIFSRTSDPQTKIKLHLRLPVESTMRRNFLSAYMPDFSFSISFRLPEAAVSRPPPLRTSTFLRCIGYFAGNHQGTAQPSDALHQIWPSVRQ